jgi:hypothetical protein
MHHNLDRRVGRSSGRRSGHIAELRGLVEMAMSGSTASWRLNSDGGGPDAVAAGVAPAARPQDQLIGSPLRPGRWLRTVST